MKNFKSGKDLLKDAQRHYRQLVDAYDERWWNIVVRRAQEVVELSLKGILKMECIEYPKIHDIGAVFVKTMKEKGIELEEEMYEKIIEISDYLAKERGPSFYGEKRYTKKDAKKAKEFAETIIEITRKILKKLK